MRGTFAAYFGFSPGDITVFAGDNGGKSSAVVPPAPARMRAKSYAAIADHVLTLYGIGASVKLGYHDECVVEPRCMVTSH